MGSCMHGPPPRGSMPSKKQSSPPTDIPLTALTLAVREPDNASAEAEGNDVIPVGPVRADVPVPDGGYGWVVVACLVAMNAVTWG